MALNYPQATVISGSAGAASGLLGSVMNYFAQKQTNKANLQLATNQNDWNVQQWERENAYNSPANQVKLLQDAGLNPNIYQGNDATAPNLESADMANQQPAQFDFNTPVQTGLSALQQAAQAEELRASIKESLQRQRFAEGFYPLQLEQLMEQNGLLGDQRTLTYWQKEIARQAFSNERLEAPLRRANLSANTQGTYQGIAESGANIREKEQGIIASRESVRQAWQSLQQQAKLNDATIAKMNADIRNINAETNLIAFRAEMARKYHIDPSLPALNNLITLALSDPQTFQSVGQTLSTNFRYLFDQGTQGYDYLGDAFNKFLGRSSHRNPRYRHAGSW